MNDVNRSEHRRTVLHAIDRVLGIVEERSLAGEDGGRTSWTRLLGALRVRAEPESMPAPVREAGTLRQLHIALLEWERAFLPEQGTVAMGRAERQSCRVGVDARNAPGDR